MHSEIRLFFCLQRKPSGIRVKTPLHLLGIIPLTLPAEYSASILIPNPISARFPLAPGYNSPSRSAKRYPFKKDDQVPICKAHRPTSETLLKSILLNSTIPQQAEKSNTADEKRRKNQERFYLDFLWHFG